MKAIELLEIVNCQCTPQESYGVFRYFSAKHDLYKMMPDELSEYMRDYFLGKSGKVIFVDYFALIARHHLIALYPTTDGDGFYHDFLPINEDALFIGQMDNGQMVYIYELE